MACDPPVTSSQAGRDHLVSGPLYPGAMPHPPARNRTAPALDAGAPLGYHGATSRTDVLHAAVKWAGGVGRTPALGHHGESRMATANYTAGARPAATHLPPVRVTAVPSSHPHRSICVVVMATLIGATHRAPRAGRCILGISRAGTSQQRSALAAGWALSPVVLVGVVGSRAGDTRGTRPAVLSTLSSLLDAGGGWPGLRPPPAGERDAMIAFAAGMLFVAASAAGWLLFALCMADELGRRHAARDARRVRSRRQDGGCPL